MKTSPGHRTPGAARAAVAATVLIAVAVAFSAVLIALGATSADAAKDPYSLKTITLADRRPATARWNPCQKAIVWRTNLMGLPAGKRSAMVSQLRIGFSRLAAADGMTYRYAGDTAFIPRQANLVSQPADIVVAAINPSATDFDFTDSSLGFGGVLWATWYGDDGQGAAVVRGYAVLIPSSLAKLKPGFGAGKTQGDLIMHELGHATGLQHVSDPAQQMYPVLTPAAPKGYFRGDLAGLAKLGVKPGCIAIPARVNIPDYD